MIKLRLLLLLTTGVTLRAEMEYATLDETFGGRARVGIVQAATRCEVDLIRIEHFGTREGEKKQPYVVVPLNDSITMSDKTLAEVKSLLFQEWEKRDGGAMRCNPEPGVRLKLSAEGGSVTILVCNQCGMFFVDEAGKIVGFGIFDTPLAKQLWGEISRTVIPDYKERVRTP